MHLRLYLFAVFFVVNANARPEPLARKKKVKNTLPEALELACKGELYKTYDLVKNNEDAGSIHTRSELDLILHGNLEDAALWHEVAKDINKKVIPPLAQMYLDGKTCNGLADIFYVSAVSVKKLVDQQVSEKAAYTAHLTMITLLSDSGLHVEAEVHLAKALALMPDDPSLQVRAALMTPAVFESSYHLTSTRTLLHIRLDALTANPDFALLGLDEFSLSPTFYFVYQGFCDVGFLTELQDLYSRAFPSLSSHNLINARFGAALAHPVERPEPRKLRVGFVSSHFRRHSICKLFCGIIAGLASHTSPNGMGFEVVVFSGQDISREDAYTARLKGSVTEFVRVNKFTISARKEVTTRHLDVLVYLDIGMDPSTSVWGASKLAPVQMCVWGHPTTTGMRSMDYFISADLFHKDIAYVPRQADDGAEGLCERGHCGDYNYTDWFADTESAFSEQLVRLPAPALGFVFARPVLDLQRISSSSADSYAITDNDYVNRPELFTKRIADLLPVIDGEAVSGNVTSLQDLVALKNGGGKLILIPQHLPKFHPSFDRVITSLLEAVPDAYLVMTFDVKKALWRRTLERRWVREAGMPLPTLRRQVLWMQNLNPNQYLGMLALGDVMLDPFPFGGGVTTLEALGVCTPVITLPGRQTVPALTAGMLRVMLGEGPDSAATQPYIHKEEQSYISSAVAILTDETFALAARTTICENVDALFDESGAARETVTEWSNFLETLHKNNMF